MIKMIRKQISVDFERKCNELSLAIVNAIQTVKDYNMDHLRVVYLDLLNSAVHDGIKRKYY